MLRLKLGTVELIAQLIREDGRQDEQGFAALLDRLVVLARRRGCDHIDLYGMNRSAPLQSCVAIYCRRCGVQ